MEKNRAKEIIVEILQKSLTGQLDPSSNFSPINIAEAIAQKIDFEKPYEDSSLDNFAAELINEIVLLKEQAQKDYDSLSPEEDKLLRNFIKGKHTAYCVILDLIHKL